MGLVEWFNNQKIIPFGRLLSFYPPFFLLGAKVRISEDYLKIRLRLPIRWYIKNNNGVMFGGAISMLSDPFPAIVFEKIFNNISAWTKGMQVKYLMPAKTTIEANIVISDEDIEFLENQLKETGKAEKTFNYYFLDKKTDRSLMFQIPSI
ncbi:MAG: DUF4442 domain-containing protein [Chloroflexia bacterium]|nr:DUF4442 domain-containing protein [Chloroflexia bacterium]